MSRRLQDLDERFVPMLARGLRAMFGALTLRALRRRLHRPRIRRRIRLDRLRPRLHGWFAAVDASVGPGPLSALRQNVPLLGLAVVLLLAAGAAAAADRSQSSSPAAVPQPAATAALSPIPQLSPDALSPQCRLGTDLSGQATVGPRPGDDVAGYIEDRSAVLAECARLSPSVPVLAVVSLDRTATPEQVAALMPVGTVLAAYVAVPASGAVPRMLPVPPATARGASLLTALRAAYSRAASDLLTDAHARQGTASTLGAAQQSERAALLATAAADLTQQHQLEAGCACVYGLAVQADLRDLQALATRSGFRAVDGAPYGALIDGLRGRPLLPAEQERVGSAPEPAPVEVGAP
ncbi:MAG TPA: hypothetical protein VHC41_03615 [Mycobacteriales bacterium]|nr:hypothetical protein [Mycobacteriales bacterium]